MLLSLVTSFENLENIQTFKQHLITNGFTMERNILGIFKKQDLELKKMHIYQSLVDITHTQSLLIQVSNFTELSAKGKLL